MKEHPILFKGPLVRAILDGTKTQTRRVITRRNSTVDGRGTIKGQWEALRFDEAWIDPGFGDGAHLKVPHSEDGASSRVRARIEVGDSLWVQETWVNGDPWVTPGGYECVPAQCVRYRADNSALEHVSGPDMSNVTKIDTQAEFWTDVKKWRPSIFMPRWACRLKLRVVDVRPERLQDISEADAMAEGIPAFEHIGNEQAINDGSGRTQGTHPYTLALASAWDAINGAKAPWVSNPWVWVYTFEREGA